MSFLDISKRFFESQDNLKGQLYYAGLYLKKAKKENKNIEKAVAYDFFSMAFLEYDLEKANYYSDLAISNSLKNPDAFYPMNAYWNKAVILSKQKKFNEAIIYYSKAENLAKKYNSDFYFAIKLNIGIIKSENLGEVNEAINIYKQCYNFYNKKENVDYYNDFRRRTMFSLADAYKSLKQNDSASYYNKMGYVNSKKYKDDFHLSLFVLNEGANLINKGNYKSALDSLNKVYFKIINNKKFKNNIIPIYFYFGKAYEGLNNYNKALENFIKVDSIFNLTKEITPEFVDGYHFIINYYKKTKNTDKQLYYINKLMEINNSFQKNYKELMKKLHNDYDIPGVVMEKESIINSLNKDRYFNYYLIAILFALFFLSLYFIYKQKKIHEIRFNKVIVETQKNKNESLKSKVVLRNKTNGYEISPEIVSEILQKLNNFEKEKKYINSIISIHTLAQDLNTNSKYLSSIINNNLNKSFTNYINDLRIDNIINELKVNKKLRKYNVKSIAEEAGFNTAESFSKAFFKRTGIKPAYFVKKLSEF
ncbi:AraC family transcriptional regulator [Flavobacterium urocaniciphilum]|nr:AraC family transcriptional regulator [Flavobacterium urocaniciphilum]